LFVDGILGYVRGREAFRGQLEPLLVFVRLPQENDANVAGFREFAGHGLRDFLVRGVHHGHQAQEGQPALDRLAVQFPGTLLDQYGDTGVIARQYPCMAKWVDHLSGFIKDGIIARDNYGDWCVPPEDLKIIISNDPASKTDNPPVSLTVGGVLVISSLFNVGGLGGPTAAGLAALINLSPWIPVDS